MLRTVAPKFLSSGASAATISSVSSSFFFLRGFDPRDVEVLLLRAVRGELLL
jgi:hypothetical protein